MIKEPKYLRLDAEDVSLVVLAFNHSRMSMFPEENHAQVKALVRQLGRFGVASPEELREDFEHRGRPPGRPPVAAPPTVPVLTTTPADIFEEAAADIFEEAAAILRGSRP
jgi:hypothetical protein